MKGKAFLVISCILLFSCENALQRMVVQNLTLESPVIINSLTGEPLRDGTHASGLELAMFCGEPNGEIHYEIQVLGDQGQWDRGVYRDPIPVGKHGYTYIVRASTRSEPYQDSPQTTVKLTFLYEELDPPEFHLSEESYNSDQLLTMSNNSASVDLDIWFHISGHGLYEEGRVYLYEGPIGLTGDDRDYTISAWSETKEDWLRSELSIFKTTIQYDYLSLPELNPPPAGYTKALFPWKRIR